MDCFHRLDVCKASRINSFKKAAQLNSEGHWIPAVQNCKIVVDTINKLISIESIKNICRFEELFVDYGDMFAL